MLFGLNLFKSCSISFATGAIRWQILCNTDKTFEKKVAQLSFSSCIIPVKGVRAVPSITDRLNAVVDHIESRLPDDPDEEYIAHVCGYSYNDVCRIFSMLADITVTDYIRKRKLTLAGNELKYGKTKVIDAALKYGYESPVSFARAFKSFHGINPGEATTGTLKQFPKLFFGISVKAVMEAVRKDTLTIGGKDYEASYFSEQDMSYWSKPYNKREYWRLEGVEISDFPNASPTENILPCSNFPPIDIRSGQIFAIDYHRKDGVVQRLYYLADGTVWNDMAATREYRLELAEVLSTTALNVDGTEYQAEYYGEYDISDWSDKYSKRVFYRLIDPGDDFKNHEKTGDVLPYNNYPNIPFRLGDVFVIDYVRKDGGVRRSIHIADNTVWNGMISTEEIRAPKVKK